jgi:ATP-dependent Lon protease
VIELSGYTLHEKLEIARRYLVPRQLEANGIMNQSVQFDDAALRTIVERYTREAGVRNLERLIGTVARGLAAKVARNQPIDATVQPEDLEEYLGPARYDVEEAARVAVPGVVTGLAYTPVGGDIIFVEATRMPGRGNFQLTGQIGDVMRESAQAALSLVRARGREWRISAEKLRVSDIHIHVPAGGVPKDGPSAGVAMLTALVSVLSGKAADPRVAMTGEITLRGLVLPVGGVKEKVLAAHRAGIRTVVLPARNRPDLHEVPLDVQDDLQFVFAEKVEEVLLAAVPGIRTRAKGASEQTRSGGRAAEKGRRAATGAGRRRRRRVT